MRDSQEMQLSHGHLSPLWREALLHEMCTKYIVHQERNMRALVLQELLFYLLTGSWDTTCQVVMKMIRIVDKLEYVF